MPARIPRLLPRLTPEPRDSPLETGMKVDLFKKFLVTILCILGLGILYFSLFGLESDLAPMMLTKFIIGIIIGIACLIIYVKRQT